MTDLLTHVIVDGGLPESLLGAHQNSPKSPALPAAEDLEQKEIEPLALEVEAAGRINEEDETKKVTEERVEMDQTEEKVRFQRPGVQVVLMDDETRRLFVARTPEQKLIFVRDNNTGVN